jgi:hypothetical protein
VSTRTRAEHAGPARSGETTAYARVSLVTGGSTPPVLVNVQDSVRGGGGYIDGYLSIEAAELMRRALNDVLGPMQEAREKKDADDRLRTMIREMTGKD